MSHEMDTNIIAKRERSYWIICENTLELNNTIQGKTFIIC